MASSDDEGEIVLENVSDYEFLSDNDSICFSKLPIAWDGSGAHSEKRKEIFVSGKADNGLMKIYKEVCAWKFELPCLRPEISVLSVEGHWIKLLKPRNAYQDIIRKIQITLHFLHFVKWNPQQSEKALWDYLTKTFSTFEKRPCEDDLVDHMHLIKQVAERDETLENSKLLSTFLAERPRKRNIYNEDVNPPFIVDDVNEEEDPEELTDEVDEDGADEDACFDSVCAICDNGGHIYVCEGKCLRTFHPTVEDGEESNCESLGFTEADLEAMKNVPFYCKNCEHKQHQCFACGELGSSDEDSGAEVFRCVNGACGHFYHPSCVAKLLNPNDRAARAAHEKRIAAGEQFVCPAHKCFVCKELEVRSNNELQFAVCRRCPRSYHRKCLPRDIAFEEDVDDKGEIIIQRAWEDLIPGRILIYCLKHKIDSDMDTPARDHIRFPGMKHDKKISLSVGSGKKKDMIDGRGLVSEDIAGKRISAKSTVKVFSRSKPGESSRTIMEKLPALESSKKLKVTTNRTSLGKSRDSTSDRGQASLGERLYATFYGMDSEPEKSNKGANSRSDQERIQKVKLVASRVNTSVNLDIDSQKRILALMRDASSSITLDQIRKKHKSPSTHSQSSKFHADNITMGKVEGTIQALRTALKKLDEGGNVTDAKAVCGNDLLLQVFKWNERFKVYLAPFLYGMRYTSFGRHFTKTDKLEEIVDILHWYIQDNDMLVDFCCGANEFSTLAKKKLDEVGKSCLFKNYDILQPKDDFCFERRDWMSVRPNELPNGSQLIMGLNPPFGINASLANKFINKALEFKPKLIVLIVPQETQRLDEKERQYDLIFEDDQMFGGRSFYLPGSVDVNDKQIEDWNVKPPVLYLWSHPDWTAKHKAIAEKHGHFLGTKKKESQNEMQAPKAPQECENHSESNVSKSEDAHPIKPETHEQKFKAEQKVEADKKVKAEQKGKATTVHLERSPRDSDGSKRVKSSAQEKKRTEGGPKFGGKASGSSERKKRKRQSRNNFLVDNRKKQSRNNFPESSPHARQSVSHHPSPSIRGRGSVEAYSSGLVDAPTPQIYPRRDAHLQFDQRNFSNYHQQQRPQNGGGYNGNSEVSRIYSLNGEEHFPPTAGRNTYAPSPRPDYSLRASTERWIGHEERGNSLAHYPLAPYNMGEVNSGYCMESSYTNPNQQVMHPHPQPYPVPGFPGQVHHKVHAPGFPGQVHHQVPAPVFPGQVHHQVSGMNTPSTMQRYASRLGMDEVNHSPVPNISGMYHTSGPRPIHHQLGSLGFAPAPHGSYSHQSSSGWLNE